MGLSPPKRRNDDAKFEASGDDAPAVIYVKELFSAVLRSGDKNATVTSKNGYAQCKYCQGIAKFVEVRNRLCVMTDTIELYKSLGDTSGQVEVMMDGIHAYITVKVYPKDNIIELEFRDRR